MWWPDFESWISWPVVVGVVAAMGTAMLSSSYFAVSRAIAVGAILWYSAALLDHNQKLPGRDWVHLMPSPHMTADNRFQLYTVSTGSLRDVRIAVQLAELFDQKIQRYIYSNGVRGVPIDKGTHLSEIALPIGEYVIDVDPPTENGKIFQRLKMVQAGDTVFVTTEVKRKSNNEILLPTPEQIPFWHKAIAVFYLVCFATFSVILLRYSYGSAARSPPMVADSDRARRRELIAGARKMVARAVAESPKDNAAFKAKLETDISFLNLERYLSDGFLADLRAPRTVFVQADGTNLPVFASMYLKELNRLESE